MAYFHPVDEGKLLKDLNENFAVKRELAMIAGALNLRYGKCMAIASAALKNVEYDRAHPPEELDKNLRRNLSKT